MNDFSNNNAEPRQIKQFDSDFYQAMIDTLHEGAFVIENKKFKLVNQAFSRLTGVNTSALIGQKFGTFIYPQNNPIAFEQLDQEPVVTQLKTPLVKKRLSKTRAEYHLVVAHISGRVTPIEINSQHFIDSEGQLYQIAYVRKKLVEQALNKALRDSENELKWLVNHLPNFYLQIDGNGIINKASHYAEQRLGFERGTLAETPLANLFTDNNDQAKVLAEIIQEKGNKLSLPLDFKSKDDQSVTMNLIAYAKNDKQGKLLAIEFFDDSANKDTPVVKKSKNKQAETTVAVTPIETPLAATSDNPIRDPLTRLINGLAFAEHLSKSIRHARRHHSQLWILYINLQNLPTIFDEFGESVSNACLVHFSQRLQSFFRDTDVVARIEEAQFAVLLDDYTSDLSLPDLIDRLQQVMDKKSSIQQYPYGFTFNIGTANFPTDGIRSKELMEHAQSMMFKEQFSKSSNSKI